MLSDWGLSNQDIGSFPDDGPDEASGLIYEEGCCQFCGAKLRSRPVFADCDDAEIYCPDCGYSEGIE